MKYYVPILPKSLIWSQNRGSTISRLCCAQAISGEFDHYAEVPNNIAELIKEGKK